MSRETVSLLISVLMLSIMCWFVYEAVELQAELDNHVCPPPTPWCDCVQGIPVDMRYTF